MNSFVLQSSLLYTKKTRQEDKTNRIFLVLCKHRISLTHSLGCKSKFAFQSLWKKWHRSWRKFPPPLLSSYCSSCSPRTDKKPRWVNNNRTKKGRKFSVVKLCFSSKAPFRPGQQRTVSRRGTRLRRWCDCSHRRILRPEWYRKYRTQKVLSVIIISVCFFGPGHRGDTPTGRSRGAGAELRQSSLWVRLRHCIQRPKRKTHCLRGKGKSCKELYPGILFAH